MNKVMGWFPPANRMMLAHLICKYDIHHVLELGTCFGRSAIWFANRCEFVQCIDTWGAIPTSDVPENVFELFVQAVKDRGLADRVTWIRGNTHDPEVQAQVRPAELVYVDAGHLYEDCKLDLIDYARFAKYVICGDDYGNVDHPGLEGVTRAVNEMFPYRKTRSGFWWYEKENV